MSCISPDAYAEAESIRTRAVMTNAVLKMAQMVAEAARNGQQLIDNYRKQHALAQRAQVIAEAIQSQQGMFWAAEQQFATEFTTPEPIEDVEVMGRRYAGRLVSSVLGGFAGKIHEIKCNMNRYCTSANMKALQDIYLMRSFAVTAARTLGRNIAFAEYQARNDLNWERRKQAAALGRKLGGDASNLIKSAGSGLASIGAGYEQSFNSALKAIGYTGARALDGEQRPSYEQVNAQYSSAAYQSNRGGQMYGLDDSFGGYYSNNGATMYGPESTGTANNLATRITGNEVSHPSDLMGESDFGGDGNGGAYDGSDTPNLYNHSLNEKLPGAEDRVRIGKVTFPVRGGFGRVEVDMARFAVGYADHMPTDVPAPDVGWPG